MGNWIPDRYRELRRLLGPGRAEEEVRDELTYHLEMRIAEQLEAGMSPEDARAEALRRFGDLERFERETREIDERMRRRRRRLDYLEAGVRAMRMAARSIRLHPGFAAVAVVTLSLGLGAVAAIFTVLNGIVLSPLPYPDSERLVWVDSPVPYVGPDAAWGLSEAGYFDFKSRNRTLAGLGVYYTSSVNLAGHHGAARVASASVSASLLDVLGARPALGRLIEEEDDVPRGPAVAVLGHPFWMREYGGDRAVIGSVVEINAVEYEVIGVMAAAVHLPGRRVDVWLPLGLDPSRRPVNAHWLSAVGRMREGVTLEAAQDELTRLTEQFSERFPGAYSESFMRESGFSTRVVSLREHVIGGAARSLWIIFASVALVLLIAGANVTNLFLVRADSRRREFAVRASLGAGRGHLVLQQLAEGVLLALIAAVLALGLAGGAVQLLRALAPIGLPRVSELGLGAATGVFTVLLALFAGLLFGVLPLAYRLVDYRALRESARGLTSSRRRVLTRQGIVVIQVSLALALLAAAGLMLRSFQQLRSVKPGLDPEGVLTLAISLPAARYPGFEEVARFYQGLLTRIEALPGVVRAGAAQRLPLADNFGCAATFVEDRPLGPNEQPPCLPNSQVTPGFFSALGIPVAGSSFDWAEVERRSGDAIVTRALAERLWPGESAIGKGIRGNGWAQPFYRVIGVTGDIRGEGLDRPPLQAIFFPMLPLEGANLWEPPRAMRIAVKAATAGPEELVPAIRRVVAELDPTVPLANVLSMEAVISRSPTVARTSFTMLLLGIAGLIALLLSVVGLYGVIAYVVGQRTAEIGLRIAFGAGVGQVVALVLHQSLRLAVAGVVLGLVASLALSQVMRSLLFEVSPSDPIALVSAAVLLLCLALLASYLPARRAARVDPVDALRAE